MAMKRTLLELTQDILASLDGDEVTDIAETAESAQVAAIIRQNFYEIASNLKLPEHYSFFELTETSSSTPTLLSKPTDVISVSWIKYDIQDGTGEPEYAEVYFLELDEFLARQDMLNVGDTDTSQYNITVGSETFPLKYRNDKMPQFYASYDDSNIIFDSVDTSIESFLRKTKFWCWGLKESAWTHTNSAVPALDHKQFNLLFQKAKAQCFVELKQAENAQAEKKARRAELTTLKEKADINAENVWYYHNKRQLPNYGRK